MKTNDLLDIIGEANDEFIHDAKANQKQKVVRFPNWAKWSSAIAACLVLVIGCFTILPHYMPDDETPSQSAGGGHEEGMVFMSYAGPVFPLTLMESNTNLEANRNINFDFTTYQTDREDIEVRGNNGGGVIVTDKYQLTNTSTNDVTVTAVYPFAGNFQTMKWPVITLNGNEVQWNLNAGTYSGDFMGAAGNDKTSSLNLDNITSWTEYAELLEDGSYFADAFTEPESLDQPVIVYKLGDLTDGAGDYEAATLCMSYKYNPEKTSIMTWGFNGGGIRADTGDEFRDFFIRDGRRKEDENVKFFIVIGDDIESYELQGYLDGSCTPGEEIDDASATVTREEMTLGEMLREIAEIRYAAISANEYDGDANRYLDKQISLDMYYQAMVKHFATYGPLGTDPKERYAFGMLTDIISEVAYHDRILYLSFEVTIPAGSSVEVNVEQFKYASFDFDCSGSENAGIDGYDMVTSLGSNIAFTGQSASISNYDAIEIVRQNFGFDIAGGITNVDLDMNEPHYYLEIREIKTEE